MFYGNRSAQFEEDYISGEGLGALGQTYPAGSTQHGPIPAEWVGTEKTGAKGPKQKKCEKAGGVWIGPDGKRWCQISTAPQVTPQKTCPPGFVYDPGAVACVPVAVSPPPVPAPMPAPPPVQTAGLPAPGSTVHGPIPSAWAGTEKTGAKGPKQRKCESQGGHWIGPERKRWCQVPPALVAPIPVPAPIAPAPLPPPPPIPRPVLPAPEIVAPTGPTVQDAEAFQEYFDCLKKQQVGHKVACNEPPRFREFYPDFTAPPLPWERERPEIETPLDEVPPVNGEQYVPPEFGDIPPEFEQPEFQYPPSGGPSLPPTGFAPGAFESFDTGAVAPGFEEFGPEPGFGPEVMAAVAVAVMNECDPGFVETLPRTYNDRYGSMKVLTVVCEGAGGGGGGGGAAPVASVEAAEMEQAGLFGLRRLG